MKTGLDLAGWEEPLDPERSFVVDGPAGTGKSELCYQRYLRTLARADEPEEVLLLVDGDRRRRLITKRLAETIGDGDADAPEQPVRARNEQCNWNLAGQPERLQIHTVETLARTLVAAAPVSSACGAGVRLTADPEGYYRNAARALLRTLDHDERVAPNLETLLLHLDNDLLRAENLLAGLLRRRVELQRCLNLEEAEQSRGVLQAALDDAIAMTLVDISAAIGEELAGELASLLNGAARELAVRGIESPIRSWRDQAGLPAADAAHLEAWRGLSELLLDDNGIRRGEFGEQQGFPAPAEAEDEKEAGQRTELLRRMNEAAARLARQPGLMRRLAALRQVTELRYSHLQWTVLQSLLAVLPRAMSDLNSAFRALGEMDHTAMLQGAARALSQGQAEVFGATSLQHMIVDDFHELSYAGIDLIEKLTAGWQSGDSRSILVTGNPFASVRRNRGAQPALYLKLHHSGLGKRKLEPLRLEESRRSGSAIVEWINRCFAAQEDGVIGEGAMPFWPAAGSSHSTGEVTVSAVAGGIRAEAVHVAQLLADHAVDGEQQTALLLADSAEARTYIDALRALGVRCHSDDVERIAVRPVIRDLHALTRALLHLADRVAWLSVLRAPWCGLTLHDLHRLVADSAGVTVWELIIDEQRRSQLSEDGQQRLSRIKRVLAQSLAERGRRDLRRLVEGVWTALGGAVCVRDEHELRQSREFFAMLGDIDDGGEPDSLEALDTAVERLCNRSGNAAGGVVVTSIRRARRRAYDTVVLAGLSHPIPPPEQDEALRWLVRPGQFGEAQLLLAPVHPEGGRDAIDLWLDSLQRSHHENELRRLLYVGASRARRRLFVVAAPARVDGQWAAPGAMSPLHAMWDTLGPQMPTAPATVPEEARQRISRIMRLPSSWLLPEAPQPKVWNVMRTADVDTGGAGPALDNDAVIAARVMTRTLGEIAREGPTEWALRSLEGIENNFQRLFGMMGMTEAAVSDAADRAADAIRRLLGDDKARWVLDAHHSQRQTPLKLTGWLDDELHSVAVDHSFVDADGIRWLVDFQYSDLAPDGDNADADAIAGQSAGRVRRKARLVRQLYAEPLQIGLLYPYSGTWREWNA